MSEHALEELDEGECLQLLRLTTFGRIGVIDGDAPLVLPINYRLVEGGEHTWLVIRTRPGGVVDTAPRIAALEIDGVDPYNRRGWSVVARGTLHDIGDIVPEIRDRFDPDPWPEGDHERWLGLRVDSLSGRRLGAPSHHWAFHIWSFLD